MLFNGKYYNKPGHLGMTRQQLKDALKALPTPEAGDAGKAVVVNADADGYELGEAGGGSQYIHVLTYAETIGTNSYDFQAHLLLDSPDPITGADLAKILYDAGFTSNINYFMVYSKQKIKTATTNKIALSTDDQIWSPDGTSITLFHTVNRIEYTGSGITSDVGSSAFASITLANITDRVIV